MRDLFGGTISKHSFQSQRNKPSFMLRWSSQEARHFLGKILPYLLVKKEQAKKGIEFQSKRSQGKRNMTKEEKESYREEINSLNSCKGKR